MLIIAILIGLALGAIICYVAMRPRAKLDQQTLRKNEELAQQLVKLNADIASRETAIKALKDKKDSLNNDIKLISIQSEQATDAIYQKSYNLMQERLSQAAEEESAKYQQAQEECKDEYLRAVQDSAEELAQKVQEIAEAQTELENLHAKARAAIEVDKRKMLEADEKNFYKLNISDQALWDIGKLKEVTQELKGDPLPINKIIWEIYYKKPTSDLLGRLFTSTDPIVGIYKITNLQTGQAYIGQSLDIRTRLRQHIKAGLGIDSSANRFYTAMKEVGPENFSYEIIEKCDKEQLNERERYWIEFYDTVSFGYNETKGGSTKRNK